MSASHDARILNTLVEALLDAADAWDAAPLAGVPGAQARRAAAADLQAEVTTLGATPETDPGLLTRVARLFSPGDTLASAEDRLKVRLDDALADADLAGPLRDTLLRTWDTLKPTHDRALELGA